MGVIFRSTLENKGFVLTNTGGGCTAYELHDHEGGHYWMITVLDGAEAPTKATDRVFCGFYNEDGDCLAVISTTMSLILDGSVELQSNYA